ncbi:inhibin alpha chain [Cheilinus undulatus]|uniref:inhibin alpha chain n=1 Tax=Cheilinus undulatus TaxID=241271 RepID=UPI001BD22839|nr:inhibin alpha chain [Cheilinus undulatus]
MCENEESHTRESVFWSYSTVMVSSKALILAPLWIYFLTQACVGDELPREAVLSWFRQRVLEGLDLEEPPRMTMQGPDGDVVETEARPEPPRVLRMSRTMLVKEQSSPKQDMTQIIVFPSSDSTCASSDSTPGETTSSNFTYYFQPSVNNHETMHTSAHFWFYAGEKPSVNTSAQLFILTSGQQLLKAADSPSTRSSDGWTTFDVDQKLLIFLAEGPFLLQVRCLACECHANEPDKLPFLHLKTQPKGPVRSPRQAPVTIPWSSSAIDLLQRPSHERPQQSDCHREEIQISFEELGWDNWIVYPKVMMFYYCNGNCSAWDRTTTMLGMTQCCAPVPGTMRSMRIMTTSDGGYSFKYETLPNIMAAECTCI